MWGSIDFKVALTKEEHNLLREIIKDTLYEKYIPDDLEFVIDEDIADEIREICIDIEVYEAQVDETSVRLRLVCNLVDKFFIG